jgi:hypothetical protein
MQHSKLKLGLASASALVISMSFAMQSASADYAPAPKDIVGVGSDTVQYASDFIADGDYISDGGYNTLGNKFKVVNFDATPDSNARLSYGPGGLSGTCTPGTGATEGTGNATTTHSDTPCTQNPTIVLRAGQSPIQRPNGSGDGTAAIVADSSINYARASSNKDTTVGASYDRITVGKDNLAMIGSTTPATNAVPLSENQLNAIYTCTATTWAALGASGAGSSDTIIPLIPQVGSGTRSTFLGDIGVTTPGGCVETVEENDPTAIAGASPNNALDNSNSKFDLPNGDAHPAADAIEPMSSGRLDMFQGTLGVAYGNFSNAPSTFNGTTGGPAGTGIDGYFKDSSCKVNQITATPGATCSSKPASGTASATNPAPDTIAPQVAYLAGTPGSTDNTGSLGKTLYSDYRNLYIYFRDSDVGTYSLSGSTLTSSWNSATGLAGNWQPGSTLNWVRTMFYNPCGTTNPAQFTAFKCSNDPIAGEVGPGGAPFYATSTGQALIAAAGVDAAYAENAA